MIKYYYGDMGSGKTLSMIIDAELIRRKIESMNKNFLCFTDIDYKYKTNELWEILDKKYENKKDYKLLLFDEMDKFTDSRRAMTDINRFISYIISLSRKTNMDCIFSTQIFSSLDKRLRIFSQYIISSKYVEDKGKITWNVYNSNNNNEYKKSMEINKDYFYGLFSTNYLTMSQIDDNLKNFNRYFKQFGKN